MIPRCVLAATDLGDASDVALRMASAWAHQHKARLAVCHVLPEFMAPDPLAPQLARLDPTLMERMRTSADKALRERTTRVTGRADGFEVILPSATPHVGILKAAVQVKADLVVLGAHARTGLGSSLAEALLGSTTERVVRFADFPVLVARPPNDHGPVVAATDLSDPSIPVIHHAGDIARALQRPLVVLHCVQGSPVIPPGLDVVMGDPVVHDPDMASRLRGAALEVLKANVARVAGPASAEVLEGDPAERVAARAAELEACVLVVGTHGRSGLPRLLLGSVAETLVRRAKVPTLVVRGL